MKYKFKIRLLTAACCLVALCGCQDKPKYGVPMTVRVFGVMGQPDLDTDLKMGLYVDEPVGIKNSSDSSSSIEYIISNLV